MVLEIFFLGNARRARELLVTRGYHFVRRNLEIAPRLICCYVYLIRMRAARRIVTGEERAVALVAGIKSGGCLSEKPSLATFLSRHSRAIINKINIFTSSHTSGEMYRADPGKTCANSGRSLVIRGNIVAV